MKRLLICAMLAVVSVACCKEGGDTQATLPGLEKDANGNYISYKGYPMPSWEPSYEGMVDLLDLVATQKGEIDDELFVEFMITNVVKANEIYFLNKYRSGYYEWYNVDHWGGNGVHYNIKLDSDGTLYSHEIAVDIYPEIEEYYAENGYEGYYLCHEWRYDAESNMLYTEYYRSPMSQPIKMSAEVIFFNGTEAVLLGHVAGLAVLAMSEYSNGEFGLVDEMELFRVEFVEGYDSFLDNYTTYEEYQTVYDEAERAYRLNSMNETMAEAMALWSNFDRETVVENLVGEWKTFSLLHYDESWDRIIEALVFNDNHFVEGVIPTTYIFEEDGRACEYYDAPVQDDEPNELNLVWEYDAESDIITLSGDGYTSEYRLSGCSYQYIVLDRVENGVNVRRVFKRNMDDK